MIPYGLGCEYRKVRQEVCDHTACADSEFRCTKEACPLKAPSRSWLAEGMYEEVRKREEEIFVLLQVVWAMISVTKMGLLSGTVTDRSGALRNQMGQAIKDLETIGYREGEGGVLITAEQKPKGAPHTILNPVYCAECGRLVSKGGTIYEEVIDRGGEGAVVYNCESCWSRKGGTT